MEAQALPPEDHSLSTPFFTVGVTTYKRPQLVVKAIQSVLAQSFTDYEVIVVDDCSPDDTERRVKAFALPNITYVRQPANQGISQARNEVIKRAQGEFIVFLDDDDRLTPDFLCHVYEAFRTMPPSVAFAVPAQSAFRESENEDVLIYEDESGYSTTTILTGHCYLQNMIGSGTGLIVRTRAARAIGGFSPEWWVAQDRYFMVQLATKWDFAIIPQARHLLNNHGESHQTKKLTRQAEAQERIGDLNELRSFPHTRDLHYRWGGRIYYALKQNQDGRRCLFKALRIAPFAYKTWGHLFLFEINAFLPISLRRRLFKRFRHGYLLDFANQELQS
jgi:glycosyltransferase involved in cell wall biosynthesis